jgi:Zn-dependent membrane protease YugP
MFFWEPTFFLLLPPLILAFYAQARVRGAYKKYSQIFAASKISGARVAHELLQTSGAGDIKVEKVAGELTDRYDPRTRVLRLSQGVYESTSIAALGIAAHESGHAIQHQSHYQPLALRTMIYPVASLGSTLAFPLFFMGFIFSRRGPSVLMDIGILLFAAAVVFSVVTLPVEFNASKRALALLEQRRFLTADEMTGARKVLKAAALTYVASTAMAAMQLLRMFILRQSRD